MLSIYAEAFKIQYSVLESTKYTTTYSNVAGKLSGIYVAML
jgi:hypothetical protein